VISADNKQNILKLQLKNTDIINQVSVANKNQSIAFISGAFSAL